MTWDCKHKIEKDRCRRRKTKCFPGGKLCVIKDKFEFPLRKELDELDHPKKTKVKKKRKGPARKPNM